MCIIYKIKQGCSVIAYSLISLNINNKTKQTLTKNGCKIQRNWKQWVHRTQDKDKGKTLKR